jgi:hypothetical protein
MATKEKIASLPPQILRAEQTSNLMRRSVEKALQNISPKRIQKYSQQNTADYKTQKTRKYITPNPTRHSPMRQLK